MNKKMPPKLSTTYDAVEAPAGTAYCRTGKRSKILIPGDTLI